LNFPLVQSPRRARLLAGIATALIVARVSFAAAIFVPNYSFESQVAPPVYPYVTTLVDSWQKPAKPAYFDETAYGLLWDQTVGLFQNTPAGASDHIDNMDGNQGAYLLAFPQVGLFQDYNTTDWNHTTPTHDFNATFQVGMSYKLTIGILGGGGGMPEGDSLLLGLYYRDNANAMVNVASTSITYTAAAFPNHTHFIDYVVNVPTVQAGDAWAGQNIGIELTSVFGTGAGYWDIDNVRLTSVPEPGFASLAALGSLGFLGARWQRRRSC
jgi:hypothetical protein